MRFFFSFIISVFLFFSPADAADVPFRLMVFGDSLSAGYNLPASDAFYTQLEHALQNKGYKNVKVVNASRAGETTSGALGRVATELTGRPDAVLVELGINDAFRQTPVPTIQSNLEKIVVTFKESGVPVMLIGMQAPLTMAGAYQQEFSAMYGNVAKKYDLFLYPFFMDGLFGSFSSLNAVSPYLQPDRAHPTAQGVAMMVKNILPTVEKFLRQFR